ncbi:MAG: hypothetical protein K6L75_13430 [Cellvibrionaceae bacterium]
MKNDPSQQDMLDPTSWQGGINSGISTASFVKLSSLKQSANQSSINAMDFICVNSTRFNLSCVNLTLICKHFLDK